MDVQRDAVLLAHHPVGLPDHVHGRLPAGCVDDPLSGNRIELALVHQHQMRRAEGRQQPAETVQRRDQGIRAAGSARV